MSRGSSDRKGGSIGPRSHTEPRRAQTNWSDGSRWRPRPVARHAYYNERHHFWALSRYNDVEAALNMVTSQYAKALVGWKINAVDPGYTATDLNDNTGHQTVAQGVRPIVALATVGPDGPTGGFFDHGATVPW